MNIHIRLGLPDCYILMFQLFQKNTMMMSPRGRPRRFIITSSSESESSSPRKIQTQKAKLKRLPGRPACWPTQAPPLFGGPLMQRDVTALPSSSEGDNGSSPHDDVHSPPPPLRCELHVSNNTLQKHHPYYIIKH
jgi:hypothetical protein